MPTILVTGGAGYIGSHCVVELLNNGYECIIIDNFINSHQESIIRQEKIAGKNIPFYKVDIRDRENLEKIFDKHNFDAVIHFAGLKAVGESCSKPLEYYHNNVAGSIILFQCMQKFNVNKIVFSSSSTVYGNPQYLPLDEKHPTGGCSNPYGTTKYMIELILQDAAKSQETLNVVSLRYFNPVGAHESGLIGEDPQDIPNNLMPFVSQVAVGRRKELSVFGNDYNTRDGTGVRDYIHVKDLACGHVAALNKMDDLGCGFKAFNLGTGKGESVLEVVEAFEKAVNKKIPYKIVGRRDGDIAENYANASLAEEKLGWKAEKDINKMCEDSWNFQSKNPMGYNPKEQ